MGCLYCALPSKLRDQCRREIGKVVKSQKDRWLQENSVFQIQPDICTYKHTETMIACTKPAETQATQNPCMEEGPAFKGDTRIWLLLGEGKSAFYSRMTLVYEPHSRAGPSTRSSWKTLNELHGFKKETMNLCG